MGEYSDVKRRRMYRLLKWLADQKGVTVESGGEHQYNIKCTSWSRPYPIPFRHGIVIKHIVKELRDKLIAAGICTKEEFDEHIR